MRFIPARSFVYALLSCGLAIGLSGCETATRTLGNHRVFSPHQKPEKYLEKPVTPQYGAWWIDTATCTIHASATNFNLFTDGRVNKDGTIDLRTSFKGPLAAPPVVELSRIPVPVPVEGARGIYRIILSYDSNAAAQMFDENTYLIVHYQQANTMQVLESSLQTRGLMFALADITRNCR